MQLIDRINSESELISLRDHFQKVLASELSITPKLRRVNDVTGKFIGAADWNTALGVIRQRATTSLPATENTPESNSLSLCALCYQQHPRKPLFPLLRTLRPKTPPKAIAFPSAHLAIKNTPESIYFFLCALFNGNPDDSVNLDDLVFDLCGTSKSHSAINNAGIRDQVAAIVESIGVDRFWCEISINHAITRYQYELWIQYGVADRHYQPVEANVHDDGRIYQIAFDAAPYFFQALANDSLLKVLEELSGCDYRNHQSTDAVVEFFVNGGLGEGHSAVRAMLQALDIRSKDPALYDTSGFDCQVSKKSLRDWVTRHAPDILKYRPDLFDDQD